MTQLSAGRNTPERTSTDFRFPIGASQKIFSGALVVVNATGFVVEGSIATTHSQAYRAEEFVDNTGGADGVLTINVRRGCFKWANSSAGDLITLADVGKVCYTIDDQTVAKTHNGNTRSVAGTVRDVEADGVWVEQV